MKRKILFIMTLILVFTIIITGCEKKELSLPIQLNSYENTTVTTVEPVSYGQSAQECFERGKSFYDPFIFYTNKKEGVIDNAIEAYSQAINYEPDNAQFYYYRGCVYYSKIPQNLSNVMPDLTKAILLDPEYEEAYQQRGRHYLRFLHDNYKAIDDFTVALRLSPRNASDYFALYPLSYNYANINEYKAIVYFDRGEAYCNIKEYNKALSDFSEAIRLYSEYDSAYFFRSNLYWVIFKNYDKSIADLTTILTFDPDNWQALDWRAKKYYELGDNNKAIDDYATLLKLNQNYIIHGLENVRNEAVARAKRQ